MIKTVKGFYSKNIIEDENGERYSSHPFVQDSSKIKEKFGYFLIKSYNDTDKKDTFSILNYVLIE